MARTATKSSARVSSPRSLKEVHDPQLQERIGTLLATEIRFVYAGEFELLEGNDRPITEAEQLLATLRQQCGNAPASTSEVIGDLSTWNTHDPLLTFEQEQVLFRALNLLRFRANRLRSRLSQKSPSAKAVDSIESMLALAEQIRSQLVRSNLRLVASISRRFSSSHQEVEEFSSDGSMILLGAIDRFDYSRRFRFSTYATHSIQRHFFRTWKTRQRRQQRFPGTSSEILAEVAEEFSEPPICPDPQKVVDELLKHAPEVLDEREHQILLSRFGLTEERREAKTLREIAADLGVSKERVRQLQLKALEKLRPFLNPSEFNVEALAFC